MIKTLQVVENDGPDEQAAAIRAGLDPARFEVAIVGASGTAPSAVSRLRRLFAERRPDVVHAHGPRAGLLARAAARSAGVPRIFYSPRGYAFSSPDRSAASRALNRTLERAAARIGATIAASPSEAEQARKLGARVAAVVRDAYLGDFPEPKAHEGLVVGSAGAMTRASSPDAWVLLAQRLCDSRNGLSCLWIGGGADEAAARVNLTNMNLLSKVEVTGALAAGAARERLRGLDVFVRYSRAPARDGALLDAMARGLPVVASDSPEHRDDVEDGVTGFLVASEVELLERCQELLDDDGLRRRLGDAGRDRLKREHSPERRLAELSRLYSA